MARDTEIQWARSTWNVVTGCTKVSPGCANCYIERTPPFRIEGRRFERVGNEETTGVRLHPERLDPVHALHPSRLPGPIFVCSLSDLFHEEVPDSFIADVFDVMARVPDRVFQVLTKRPERAREWAARFASAFDRPGPWPLPNVWVGVSIENARFTWRADVLREIPAAVRFISAEPLLGSLFRESRANSAVAFLDGKYAWPLDLRGIDWVIVGGESGPRARRTNPIWIHELLDACEQSGVAPFVKQLGRELAREWGLADRRHGGEIDEWPEWLRVREFPRTAVPA